MQKKSIFSPAILLDKNLLSPLLTTLLSGSPIVQNGRLVGAVTHILMRDQTQGYEYLSGICSRRQRKIK
ncbi:MAG: hypothetical protein E7582_05005 [Ruminococcaceae bacterium]|nr:hypothetical protein [Oscillospiraceae bacterium]